ncbi:MAG: metallophosphoesterase [Anaerovoracaceae bacterium]
MKTKKKKKKKGCLTFLTIIIFVLLLWWVNTFTLKTTEVNIQSQKIHDAITFVQITDLHGSLFGKENEDLIKEIDKAEPDFIVATGDMYTAGDEEGKTVAINLLTALSKKYDVYSVNGEHDNDSEYLEQLESVGVDVLDYEKQDITIGDTTVCLYGISNVYYTATFDLDNAIDLDKSKYNILLAHIENFKVFAHDGIDLSLSGDSHGGQVRLPFIGGLINRNIWVPELLDGEAKYVKGLYKMGNSSLFVSSGLGNYPVPIRFMNRPEIAVIHLND